MYPLTFPTITNDDFHVFAIHDLEPRMEALKRQIRPKLEMIGETVAEFLSTQIGDAMHPHVAKHARRTIHPPEETWVAWATNRRGYKSHPHFQVGLRDTYLFAWFALIYECEQKTTFAANFLENLAANTKKIPSLFYLSEDHTQPDVTKVSELSQDNWKNRLNRLASVKKAEFLCGLVLPREEVIKLDSNTLQTQIEESFQLLLPLYHLSFT